MSLFKKTREIQVIREDGSSVVIASENNTLKELVESAIKLLNELNEIGEEAEPPVEIG